MKVREVLEKYSEYAPMTERDLTGKIRRHVIAVDVLRLAPIIERALRTSYRKGQDDALADICISIEERGVEAGANTISNS